MRIVIGADHAGVELKGLLHKHLQQLGWDVVDVVDVGTFGLEPVDYPDVARSLADAVLGEPESRGILICGSGVGASVAANKIPGIRAGLCHDTYSAHQGVEHDNMNVLILGGRVIGPALANELVQSFLNASFSAEERHVRRLAKVTALENQPRSDPPFPTRSSP